MSKLLSLLKFAPLLFFIIAVAHFVILSQYNDGDFILTQENSDIVVDTDDMESVFLVCQSEAEGMPDYLVYNGYNQIPLGEARPMTLTNEQAKRLNINQHAHCASSSTEINGLYKLPKGSMHIEVPDNAVVIATHSNTPRHSDGTILFTALLLLMIGTGYYCVNPKPIPQMRKVTSLIAFITTLALAIGLASVFQILLPPESGVISGYGSVMASFSSNCLAYILVSVICFVVAFKRSGQPKPLAKTSISKPFLYFFLAIGLVIFAMMSVILAPMPDITLTELTSFMTSTRFVTAYFAIMAGIYEECLFRGVIQTSLMPAPGEAHERIKNIIAVAITTVLFVGLHVPQSIGHLWALTPIAAVSVASSILRIKSQTIFPSILLHITYNGCLLIPSTLFMTSTPL